MLDLNTVTVTELNEAIDAHKVLVGEKLDEIRVLIADSEYLYVGGLPSVLRDLLAFATALAPTLNPQPSTNPVVGSGE